MERTIRIIGAALAGIALAGPVAAQDDAMFVANAVRSNMAEVMLGELAQERGRSEDVRDFGEMLATDHGRTLEKVTELAKALDVTVPTEPSAKQQEEYATMAKLSGAEFDRQFAMHMVMAHEQNVAEHRKQSEDGSNERVEAYAKEVLPTLQRHLETARNIERELASSN